LKNVAKELRKNKLHLVGAHEFRCEKRGTKMTEDYTFFYGERNEDYQLGTGSFLHKKFESAVRKVDSLMIECHI
jgi:hypothetical protein